MAVFYAVVLVALAAAAFFWWQRTRHAAAVRLADAKADARQAIERLAGQVYALSGSNDAARQAIADAAERNNAAGAQIDQATTPAQARLAKQTAIEGLYYIRAARTAMDMDPGPGIPVLDGQQAAGVVTQPRETEYEGRRISAAPAPSDQTPNYYPGGMVAGRPVPAGWYSEPWWKPALIGGAWGLGTAVLFSALLGGMPGLGYDPASFADNDVQDSFADPGADGGNWETDDGSSDFGDFGGGDLGGGDFGGGGDF